MTWGCLSTAQAPLLVLSGSEQVSTVSPQEAGGTSLGSTRVSGDVQHPSCSLELLSPAEMTPASHLPCRKGSAVRRNTADTPSRVWAPCPLLGLHRSNTAQLTQVFPQALSREEEELCWHMAALLAGAALSCPEPRENELGQR